MVRPRHVLAAAAVLAAACSSSNGSNAKASSPPPPSPSPPALLHVHVSLPDEPSVETNAWAEELETAIGERRGDLALEPEPVNASLEVRVTSVTRSHSAEDLKAPGEGDPMVMQGTLVAGGTTRALTLRYRGEVWPQAEALSLKLRRYADELAATATPAPTPAVAR
jgi:hypothetical protein